MKDGPHQGQSVVQIGQPLDQAKAAMILIHGRGATADSILTLVPELTRPEFAYCAPQAGGFSWYPNSFLAPLASNEPGISSGMAAIGDLLDRINAAGIPSEKVLLLGFSQGACLVLEFTARNARRYGGVVGLSGGLIGPEGTLRDYGGTLAGTPVFLGCSDPDGHIPAARVRHSADILANLGAEVTMRLYPNMGHVIIEDELVFVREMMAKVVQPQEG